MKIILAIGGAVIKTAMEELRQIISAKKIDVLIHNGASIFHDFQRNTENLESHSHSLDALLNDYNLNREASESVWKWIKYNQTPNDTITSDCYAQSIDVLLFSSLGTDFWQLFCDDWYAIGNKCQHDFYKLCEIIGDGNFIFINMGSAVIMPEVFTKALAVVGIDNIKNWKSHVVDFLPDQYRPLTRVAKYGKYFVMDHKEFLTKWSNGEIQI